MPVRSEIIIVRSLAESDLGLFTAHRTSATSKQRAIAMTSPAARHLLSKRLFELGGTEMDVICIYGSYQERALRHLGKVTKNWRLGGHKISESACGFLDGKDFVLLRSVKGNDGDHPILMTFVGRQRERLLHAGIAASLDKKFQDSVVIVESGSETFDALAVAFPDIPAKFAIGPAAGPADEPVPERMAGSDGR
jgi:hypothetical protein